MTGDRRVVRTIETRVGRFELLEGGVLFWTVAVAAVLDQQMAREAEAAAADLASGGPVVIIADARDLGFADRKARDIFAASKIDGRVATGVIVSNRVVQYLANQYARGLGDRRPFGIFRSEADALTWATEELLRSRRAG